MSITIISWCPGDPCDPCKAGTFPNISVPNLKQAYFKYPGIPLYNEAEYWNMLAGFETSAGSYTAHGAIGSYSVTYTVYFTYVIANPTAFNTEWDLKIDYRQQPPSVPTGIVWTVTGNYLWIKFQPSPPEYLAVQMTDPVVQVSVRRSELGHRLPLIRRFQIPPNR